MRSNVVVLALLVAAPVLASEIIELDRCIANKCHKNGRYRQVQITADSFIVYIDADRCPGQDTYCPTSYEGFAAPDGTLLDSGDYVPGEKTRGMIKIYVPRQYKGVHVRGINGSSRDDFLALSSVEDFDRARATERARPEIETSLDALFLQLSKGYTELNATSAAGAYAEDATYMPPSGEAIRGREAIERSLTGDFERAAGGPQSLTFHTAERVVEGRLAYETGGFVLLRHTAEGERESRGKYVIVARFTQGRGWRLQVHAFSTDR